MRPLLKLDMGRAMHNCVTVGKAVFHPCRMFVVVVQLAVGSHQQGFVDFGVGAVFAANQNQRHGREKSAQVDMGHLQNTTDTYRISAARAIERLDVV